MHAPSRLALLPLAALAAACVHSDGPHHPPALFETEPNDDACCADDFGLLFPGDHLVIQGAISDSGFDPFDGFAFTAAEPITVELRLYASSSYADLDVCLFDPALGLVIDCFESPFDPEVGVAHVTVPGADFHLVIHAFEGSSAYALELDVHPLHLASAAADGALSAGGPRADRASSRARAFDAYRSAHVAPAAPRLLGAGRLIEIDPATGAVVGTAFLVETSEGTLVWMGNPDEADAGEDP